MTPQTEAEMLAALHASIARDEAKKNGAPRLRLVAKLPCPRCESLGYEFARVHVCAECRTGGAP